MNTNDNCGNCRFYRPHNGSPRMGTCRVGRPTCFLTMIPQEAPAILGRPAQMSFNAQFQGNWPPTNPTEWCGEHQRMMDS